MKKICSLCNENKAKRICFMQENSAICPLCCATARSQQCEGCSYYVHSSQYQQKKHKNTGRREFVLELKPELEQELNRAVDLIDMGKLSDAQIILDKIARIDTHYYLLEYARGIMCIKQERFDEAIICLDKATLKFPDFMEAFFNKGMIYKEKYDIANMVREFREVLRCGDADDANVRWVRKFLDDMAQNIMKTDGIHLDAYIEASDCFYNGLACMEIEEWANAVVFFKQGIALNKKNPKLYGNIGLCYAKLGDKIEALKALNRAIEIDPDYEPALLNSRVVSQLSEGESLPGGPIKTIDYSRDYGLKRKSLIREMQDVGTRR